MRSTVFVVLLLTLASTVARADDGDTHDGGFDRGAKLATAGGILFAVVYPATAIGAHVGDSLCGLNYGGSSCDTGQHSALEIPFLGGFFGPPDWSRGLGIASSLFQITAAGLIIGGLATHHWRVKNEHVAQR